MASAGKCPAPLGSNGAKISRDGGMEFDTAMLAALAANRGLRSPERVVADVGGLRRLRLTPF